jgi:hypothetical protein
MILPDRGPPGPLLICRPERSEGPAVQQARLGHDEELGAIKRLDDQARRLEAHAVGPGVDELMAEERQASPDYGGMSVFGVERSPSDRRT